VTITARTVSGAAAGSAIKSATCIVTVKKPVAPIEIGDFYYSDGTWSTELNKNKTVIGVVFSKLNAVSSDNNLLEDFPNCSNGLVVGLPEYSSVLGQFGYASVYNWFISNGYPAFVTNLPNGYGNTLGFAAYRKANPSYAVMFDPQTGPLSKHNVTSPDSASSWYIPSYKEMMELYTNKSTVNAAISAAGGTLINQSLYWSSTLRSYNSYNDCQGSPVDMINGSWYSYDKKTTPYPVRVVLAF
jgi:hypothetical protein